MFVTGSLAKKDMSDNIESQFFEIDANVKDMMWCGADNESILIHTING